MFCRRRHLLLRRQRRGRWNTTKPWLPTTRRRRLVRAQLRMKRKRRYLTSQSQRLTKRVERMMMKTMMSEEGRRGKGGIGIRKSTMEEVDDGRKGRFLLSFLFSLF